MKSVKFFIKFWFRCYIFVVESEKLSEVEFFCYIYGVRPSATNIDYFPKSPSEERLSLSMWEWPNLFSLVRSIFIGQIYFHWSNLFYGIYGVRPSATKIDFFSKNPSLKKALFISVGVGK